MIGAIAGDIIGSAYEAHNYKTTDFPLFAPHCTFTDDTVLTVADADYILHGNEESRSVVDAIRKAVSIGGDSDTIACIAGGIAHAYYGKIGRAVEEKVMAILDDRLRGVVLEFRAKYGV